MAFKYIVCGFALIQAISANCIGSPINGINGINTLGFNGINGINGFNGINGLGVNGLNGLAYNGIGLNGLNGANGACNGVASTGGGFAVTSSSSTPPVGVSVVSENAYEGPVNVGGNLPLLGTVAVEGNLPTAGAGGVSYGCGDGAVGIASEGPVATGIVGNSSPAVPATSAGQISAAAPLNAGLNAAGAFNRFGLGYGRFGVAGNCVA